MNTVIVPVDFSETSFNAARYAIQLLTGHYGVNMILHHVYEKPEQADEVKIKLEQLNADLRKIGIVKTEILAEEGDDFITELEKLARHRHADLVIMGITGRSSISQSLIGSNALEMLNTKACPVLIIPSDCKYSDLKNVLLTSDFKDVVANTPSVPIREFLKAFHPKLYIVNVDSEHYVALTEETQSEKAKLKEMFNDLNPEFYFLGLNDVDEGISQFSEDRDIDLVIIIHKDQSIFSKLFVKSRTKKLVYQSRIPVLAVHE